MAETITLTGVQQDITIQQGSSVEIEFQLRDENDDVLDMDEYDLRLQVRKSYGASGSALINCTLANEKLDWVTRSDGKFKLVLAPSDTSSILFAADSADVLEGVYDMEVITPAGAVSKPWYGNFTILREVTR
jgi:hypothetical protein